MSKSEPIREALLALNAQDPDFIYGMRTDIKNPSPKRPENYRRQNKKTLKIDQLGFTFADIQKYIDKRLKDLSKSDFELRIDYLINDMYTKYKDLNLIFRVKGLFYKLGLKENNFKYSMIAPFLIRADPINSGNIHYIRYSPCIYSDMPPDGSFESPVMQLYRVENIKEANAINDYLRNQAAELFPNTNKCVRTLFGVNLRDDPPKYTRLSKEFEYLPYSVSDAITTNYYVRDYVIVFFEIFTYSTAPTQTIPQFTIADQIPLKNCLIECAHYEQAIKRELDQVYADAPLSRESDRYIIASYNLETFANLNRIRIRIFTAYGSLVNKPLMEVGYEHSKILNIRYDEGHARIIRDNVDISEIRYREQKSNLAPVQNEDHTQFFDSIDEVLENTGYAASTPQIVADVSPNVIEEYPNYKITQEGKKYIIHKDFKPSSFTKDPKDDTNLKYARCFDSFNVFYKIFKQKNNIKATREHIDQYTSAARFSCVKSAILNAQTLPDVQTFIICDHIKSFASFERSEYYMGMPTQDYTREIPVTDQYYKQNKNLFSLAYVTITPDDSEMFKIVDNMILHTARKVYLPSPLLACFDVVGIKYTASAGIQTTFNKEFGIIDLVEKYNAPKIYPNKAFGRLIAGGLSARDNYTHFNISDPAAAELIKYEMTRDNIDFVCVHTETGAKFTADITTRTKYNSVHIAAFIYAYSAAAIITEIYNNYRDYSALPCAYYVDGLLYTSDRVEMLDKNSQERGKFKYMMSSRDTREFLPYGLLATTARPRIVYKDVAEPKLCTYLRDVPANNKILVCLPAGIGKTYSILNYMPSENVAILAYTNPRVEGIREDVQKIHGDKYASDIMTCHKFFGLGITEDITKENLDRYKDHARAYRRRVIDGKKYSAIILDEFTLTNKILLNAIEECAARIKANIYVLGDYYQCNLGFDAPITREHFNDYHIIGSEQYPRTPDMKCRHTYSDGVYFDYLRTKSTRDILLELIKPENVAKYGYRVMTHSEHIAELEQEATTGSIESVAACGVHKCAAMINAEYLRICRENNLTVRGVNVNDTRYKKAQYANDSPDLFIKKNMKDRSGRVMIAYARSIYTLQGDKIDGRKLYVYSEACVQDGELYTSITRIVDLKNLVIVINPYDIALM